MNLKKVLLITAPLAFFVVYLGADTGWMSRARTALGAVSRGRAADPEAGHSAELSVLSPFDGTLFPADMRSPEFRWDGPSLPAGGWRITVSIEKSTWTVTALVDGWTWTPPREVWESIKRASLEKPAKLEICAAGAAGAPAGPCAHIGFTTSGDPVGAPIFFRAVPRPFPTSERELARIKWKLGWVSSYDPAIVVMKNQTKCFNCHVSSFNGKFFGFIGRLGSGSADAGYIRFSDPGKKVVWSWRDYFNWNDPLPIAERDNHQEILSAISPDGKFIVSGARGKFAVAVVPIKDQTAFDLITKASLFYRSEADGAIRELPGAADGNYARAPGSWSPDGSRIFFIRAPITEQFRKLNKTPLDGELLAQQEKLGWRELDKLYPFRYDVYSIPFNGGKGGKETPVKGASGNGKSNYFPKISPDGKWLVFTQSANGVFLMRQDSRLWIVPSAGGAARELRSNGPGANSWHSWSPNGRWLAFSSKASADSQTDIVLTHIDEKGNDSPRVVLTHLRDEDGLSANLPEFFNIGPGQLEKIDPSGVSGPRPGHAD